jgi:predicted PurR-regulated permease PerM
MINKKICVIALVLLAFLAIGSVIAQSQSAENLVRRIEALATRWESMERQTRSLERLSKINQQTLYSLEDDSERLMTDLTYAGYNDDFMLTSEQSNRLVDASRRIENAKSQIMRAIARLPRD